MFNKLYLLLVGLIFTSSSIFAQSGSLEGKITDKNTGETVPFANVVAKRNGNQVAGVTTDFDGNYTIKPLDPGTYDLIVSFVGYGQVTLEGIVVSSNKITFRDVQLSEGIDIEEVVIKDEKPLLDPDNLGGKTVTSEEIRSMPTRSVTSVAATAAGVYQSDEGSSVNVRGSRSEATDYYVDGVKVRGSLALPQSAIEQITVMSSGLSAMYGDATGGIISVTSKGPSNQLYGGAEVVSSHMFDDYNYGLLGFGLSGPIYKEIKEDGSKGRAILGYFLAGEFRNIDDASPSAVGVWKIKDDKLEELKENLFVAVPNQQSSSIGLLSNATFLRADDFENVQAKMNTNSSGFNLSAKLDFKPTLKTNLTLGGAVSHSVDHPFVYTYSLLNWQNNSEEERNTWRTYARFTQRFGAQEGDEESASNIKNAYYNITVDYTRNDFERRNPNHGQDLFRYGHVGKFNTYKDRFYTFGEDTASGVNGFIHRGFIDTLMTFDGSNSSNPDLAAYTQQYYDMFSENELQSLSFGGNGNRGVIRTANDLGELGLLNGQGPRNVYSLYYNYGDQYGSYGKQQAEQFSIRANGSADIKDHAIQFGFEYEKRTDRSWFVAPNSLWGLARQLTNFHILELDLANPQFNALGTYDQVYYNRLVNTNAQSRFDASLREKYNIAPDEFIDIDSYDPDQLSIDMFSADELNENGLVSYYGYDYKGDELNSAASIEDFFSEKNDKEDFTRNIGAFEPIYTAGYIQDKFAFDDLIFSIGLRVDRYDANQSVLADEYCLYDTYTASSNVPLLSGDYTRPAGIGDDYVVYVNDLDNPTEVVGYRNGQDWFDENGEAITDPKILAQASTTGQITPYLVNSEDSIPVFKDFEPQTDFSPRISFSFPISDEAQFFAHYDVLTQRPPTGNRLNPISYLYLAETVNAFVNNPNLKSEKTVDFELGFAQTLNLNSSLTLSAFYRELRDMIQVVKTNYSYPVSYLTYGNIDFSTVKGFSALYEMRRSGNVSMSANYTLQFANGTGSSSSSALSLVNTGQPNLRTTIPLSYDQRHAFNLSMDYRFDSGKDYNGPVWFNKQVLANAGANFIIIAGSGTPYSRQSNITQDGAFGINQRSTLDGSLNGSRNPWTVRINTKINKRFSLDVGQLDNKKKLGFNVYLQVQNLLNTKNVRSVYRATGNPDDDGYLSDASAQTDINAQNDPQSFRDMYMMKINNPSNYSLPRMARLGIEINF
ncbi:MAG: carboxypeptidase-like regulatory domain-containing protein [Flavobacteriales bacterium]|nr:carboxypeptidase-like regulatory domain-containing protein [Flavobacteriales bacterium]